MSPSQNASLMTSTPTSKACSHDFIAPDGKPEHAICSTCGSEPKFEDYGNAETYLLRYLPVREWVDIALTCVKVG